MPKLRTDNSLQKQEEKRYRNQLLRGFSAIKQAVSNSQNSTHGTVNQSIQMGLAASIGLGGLYGAASNLFNKTKKITKGVSAIAKSFRSDVEEEDVFSPKKETKQPGFFGIAGLAKYGFRHVVKAIKANKKGEKKAKKSFFELLVNGLKHLLSNKWFLGGLVISVLGLGIWNFLKKSKEDQELLETQQEALKNSSSIEDPDFLSDAREEELTQEFIAVAEGIHKAAPEVKKKWQKDLENLEKIVDNKTEIHHSVSPTNIFQPTPQISSPYVSLPIVQKDKINQITPLGSPVVGDYRVSSGFGLRKQPKSGASINHKGIDLAVPIGTPIVTPAKGIVSQVNYDKKTGLYVKVKHENGLETLYGHLSNSKVVPGQTLQGGEIIGLSGNTGNSTGPHVHYEIRKNGVAVDPLPYLNKLKPSIDTKSRAVAVNNKMSSNIKEEESMNSSALLESEQQLIIDYNNLSNVIQEHIDHPEYLKKVQQSKGEKVFSDFYVKG